VPTILLAQEDPDAAAELNALLQDFFPTAQLQLLTDFTSVAATLASGTRASLLLSDIFWGDVDQSGPLLLLAEAYPETPIGIVSRFDLSQTLPPAYPIPWLKADDHLPLAMAELMENFSGRSFGPYSVLSPAGPHPLGRLYWAKHQQLERKVQLLVPPTGSRTFSKEIRAYARLNHASVYSLYESIPSEDRIFVALEPVIHPTLLHIQNQSTPLTLLSGARLANTLASVLSEMESSSIPSRLLGPYDYTLSPNGTPRLRNPVAYLGLPESSHFENSNQLASLLESLLPPSPATSTLLKILRNPGTSAFDLLIQTRNFERQLADVQEVHVRDEEIEAAKKMIKARILRRWTIVIGSLAAVVFLIIAYRTIYGRLFLDLPGTLDHEEILVPAGHVSVSGSDMDVQDFYLDRHEVTIGQYEKFLEALPKIEDWKTLLPPTTTGTQSKIEDFEPPGWKDILNRARRGDEYNGQIRITRDTPVFLVNYPSAYAYAKWKNRRLPSMSEWLRAASGNDRRTYPWGTNSDALGINLGIGIKESELNTYDHMMTAESNPADIGPFKHFDLGGNLSEWLDSPNPLTRVFIGGNFRDLFPVSNAKSTRVTDSTTGAPFIGFRTARSP
jgi:hypothetical protein